MYYLLGLCLCAAALLMAALASFVMTFAVWPLARRVSRDWPASDRARLIFAIRVLPVCLCLTVTFGLALPSFLLKEPVQSGERVGFRLAALAVAGAAIFLAGAYRVVRDWRRVNRLKQRWMAEGLPLSLTSVTVPVFEVPHPEALIAVMGIFHPTVFLSRQVVESLETAESRAGIAHELAHISARDNIKQVLLHAWRLPFLEKLTGMDAEWQLASEIAADENAVVSGASILDLASALVKVARLRLGVFTELHPAVVCFVPATRETLLSARILHLMSLLERGGVRREESSLSYPGIWLAAAAILTFVSLHAGLLSFAHQLLEKIV